MFINELLEKDIIVIDATDTSNHTIKMETTVISLESEKDIKYMHSIEDKLQGFKYSIVQPLKNNNQLINFSEGDVNCSAIGVHNKKAYAWDKVAILKVKFPVHGIAHIVVSNEKASSFNRRSEYRLPLCEKANVVLRDRDNEKKEAIIHDLSEHGVGFIVESNIQIPLHSRVLINFVVGEEKFNIPARVIRSVPIINDRTLLGCVITVDNSRIPEFIYEQQRLRMRKGGV